MSAPHSPRVSLVVPTRNSARTLTGCLGTLRAQTHPDVEVVVVDNGSTDETPAIAARFADIVLDAGGERSVQRNVGMHASSGSIVGFIDSDMYLTPDVVAEVVDLLDRSPEVGGVVVPEYSVGEGFLAACRALEKRLYVGDPDVEAARFFRRPLLDELGGYRDEIRGGGEDWELPDRIEAAGHRIDRIEATILHDDGRISLRQSFAKKRYYGRSFARYLDVRDHTRPRRMLRPAVLAKPHLLASDPVHTVGLATLKAVEVSGLALGIVGARLERR